MLLWESLKSDVTTISVVRAKVAGGWLVLVTGFSNNSGLAFIPDPTHSWDGTSK